MYAELHVKTNFSFLEGASHPDELVERAAELGYTALAVTDRQSLAGVVRAHAAAKAAGLKLLVGAEITPEGGLPLVLLPTDRAAYGRLARLLTRGSLRAEKGQCRLLQSELAEAAEGLIACIIPQNSPLPLDSVQSYHETFGDRCYLLAEVHRGPDDRRWLQRLVELARRTRVPLVAGGDVHYHIAGRKALHDVLTAIRLGTTVAGAAGHLFPNAQRHLKTPEEMAAALAAAPGAVERTTEIADRVGFSLGQLRYEYPRELAPEGESPIHYLARLAWAGARKRYPRGVPEKVRGLLEHELRLIEELHYEAYFLTVWDLVRFARRRGILCQGRGSAANSAVCYCLGVTSVDPERMDVLFERFVSRRTERSPGHRRRFRAPAPRGGDAIPLREIWPRPGRHDRRSDHLPPALRHPRRGQGPGPVARPASTRWPRAMDTISGEEPQFGSRCREAGIDPDGPSWGGSWWTWSASCSVSPATSRSTSAAW